MLQAAETAVTTFFVLYFFVSSMSGKRNRILGLHKSLPTLTPMIHPPPCPSLSQIYCKILFVFVYVKFDFKPDPDNGLNE